jgi:hypothetical protein
MIMSNSIAYLTSRANFLQVSPEIPITKQRNPEKVDPPDVFEGLSGVVAILCAQTVQNCVFSEQERTRHRSYCQGETGRVSDSVVAGA